MSCTKAMCVGEIQVGCIGVNMKTHINSMIFDGYMRMIGGIIPTHIGLVDDMVE